MILPDSNGPVASSYRCFHEELTEPTPLRFDLHLVDYVLLSGELLGTWYVQRCSFAFVASSALPPTPSLAIHQEQLGVVSDDPAIGSFAVPFIDRRAVVLWGHWPPPVGSEAERLWVAGQVRTYAPASPPL